jgi:predicted secreted hydrolase
MKPLILWTTCLKALLIILLIAAPAGAQDGDFLKVTGPCGLSFPADHGPHPDYRTEWWYYTGNLTDADENRFGFQLTFFRSRLKPPADDRNRPQPASAWRSNQIYLAHAALTDITGGRHLQSEKTARPVLSLAGAEQEDAAWKIHIHAWQTVISPASHRLQADADGFGLTLDLKPAKPPVLHGQDGYSLKGQTPERASCYYSFTRLQAGGTLSLDGARHTVEGTAWMDHEFSSAPLQPGISGWDWFSVQLSDQTEIMVYLLRQPDGSLNPASSGTYVPPSGKSRHLERGDVQVKPLAFWTSPHSGARYPTKWKLVIPVLNCDLTVTAGLADQEMQTPRSTSVTYWEGSVRAQGIKAEKAVEGLGYVELTGYARPFEAPM